MEERFGPSWFQTLAFSGSPAKIRWKSFNRIKRERGGGGSYKSGRRRGGEREKKKEKEGVRCGGTRMRERKVSEKRPSRSNNKLQRRSLSQ
jgi:hypothetical protein